MVEAWRKRRNVWQKREVEIKLDRRRWKKREMRRQEEAKGRREEREEEEVWVLEEDRGKGMPPFIPRTYMMWLPMCENTTTGSWRPPPDLAAVARFQLWLAAPFNT